MWRVELKTAPSMNALKIATAHADQQRTTPTRHPYMPTSLSYVRSCSIAHTLVFPFAPFRIDRAHLYDASMTPLCSSRSFQPGLPTGALGGTSAAAGMTGCGGGGGGGSPIAPGSRFSLGGGPIGACGCFGGGPIGACLTGLLFFSFGGS